MPADRQASPVGVSEREAPLTQLVEERGSPPSIRDRLPLLAIPPAAEDGEHHVESRRVDQRGESTNTQPKLAVRTVSAKLWDSTRVDSVDRSLVVD